MKRGSHARLGVAQVCLAGVLWGTGGLSVQLIRRHADLSAVTVSAWRMTLAAIALLAWTALRGELGAIRVTVRAHRGHALGAGAATAAYQALYFGAVVNVGVSVSTVVALGLAPVLLTAAESIRRRRPPAGRRLLVLVIALAGLVLVSVGRGRTPHAPHPELGLLLAIASGATYAFATDLARPAAAASASPTALATITSLVGVAALVPLSILAGPPYATGSAVALGWLAYLGVMSLAVAYTLFYAGLRSVRGSAAVLGTLLEPVTAAVLAGVVLGEHLGVAGVTGAAMILAAVAGLGDGADAVEHPAELPPP